MTTSAPSSRALDATLSTDEIDGIVHDLIDAHFAGQMSEEETRRSITGALYVSGIHDEVARTRTDLSPQGRSDLAERLLSLVTDKVINGGNFYDLNNGRKGSACGWARQFAKVAAASEMRNLRRADNRNGTPLDPSGHEFGMLSQTQHSLIVWDSHASYVDDEVGALVEQYTTMTKGMRETGRMVINGEALCLGLGVNAAIRPDQMEDRDFILDAITADENLARRSLAAWFALITGDEPTAAQADVDMRIVALWDDQTEDSAYEILAKSAWVAHTLALAAVSPLPRPSKKVLLRLKTVTSSTAPARDKAWREIASALTDSYVASEFEPFSQFATMTVEAKEAATTGHTISRSRFETLLHRAANHPGSPMGRTPDQVLTALASIAAEILAEEPSKHSIIAAAA